MPSTTMLNLFFQTHIRPGNSLFSFLNLRDERSSGACQTGVYAVRLLKTRSFIQVLDSMFQDGTSTL